MTSSLCPSMAFLSNCVGGGVIASLSTSPRLALVGQQECTDKFRFAFTAACVIIRGRKKSLNSILGWLWFVTQEAVHEITRWLLTNYKEKMLRRRICPYNAYCLATTKYITISFVDNLSECWFHAAHPSRPKKKSLGPIWCNGNKKAGCIQATSLLPGDRDSGPETRDCNNSMDETRHSISPLLQLTHFFHCLPPYSTQYTHVCHYMDSELVSLLMRMQ